MSELIFDCVDVSPDRYAAAPTLVFRLQLSETTGEAINAIALRCQLRIEPQRRRYSRAEEERLSDLFGDAPRWGETLKPFQFGYVTQMVPSFSGRTEVELPVPFTYDLEVASTRYFHSLEDGEIPLLLLFSGSVFVKGGTGLAVEQVPWHKEASYRLPVKVWQELMDLYFPNSAWIRMRRDTVDALQRFKSNRVLTTWDETMEVLLAEADEGRA